MQSAVCGLWSAVCSLRSAVCSLQSANVIHRFLGNALFAYGFNSSSDNLKIDCQIFFCLKLCAKNISFLIHAEGESAWISFEMVRLDGIPSD